MRVLLLMGLVATLAAPVQAQAPTQALPTFDIMQYYTEAQFQAAIAPYTAAIARNPNDARAHYWLGVGYVHLARLHMLGVAPFASGFAGRAVAELETALRLQPATEVILALMDAYALAGAMDKHRALTERVAHLAQPLPFR